MSKNKGFTLIELLVVIAIIGILSSVVLMNLTSAKNKSANSAIMAGLNQARAQADIYYNINGTFDSVCATSKDTTDPKGINNMILNSAKANALPGPVRVDNTGGASIAVSCNDTAAGWAAEVQLKGTTDYYCVDYTRKGIVTPTPIGGLASCQ